MLQITNVSPSIIELRGVNFREGDRVQKILDICHKYKHMYLEGYPCGRKTRKNGNERHSKWKDCPHICITYLLTDDNQSHNLAIHVLVSDIDNLLSRYTKQEIEYHTQQYLQDVSEEIISNI